MARRKSKNPGTGTNILVALGVGTGVYILVRTLQKGGYLGENGEGYATKPKPQPVYNPTVVRTLQQVKTVIPTATRGPVAELYGALKKVELNEAAAKKQQAEISANTRRLQTLLRSRDRLAASNLSATQKMQKLATLDTDINTAKHNEAAARRAYEARTGRELNEAYRRALAAAKSAMTQRGQMSLKSDYGDKGSAVLDQLRSALIDAGETEILTSEGSVPL